MFELAQAIPDYALLVEMAPEELGAKILFLMRKRKGSPGAHMLSGGGNSFSFSGFEAELWQPSNHDNQPRYPREKKSEIMLALTEAWVWLEAQGLLVPEVGDNGLNGWRVLSRRARTMENDADFASFRVGRLLPKELLHPKIANRVWSAFMRGEFEVAAFQAMKGVEVSVRTAAGLGDEFVGVKLMRNAFAPENGPLTDMIAESGERQGRMDCFAGAVASYKNPHSHRNVGLDDPLEALEIVFLANHLLRIVDERVRATSHERVS